MEQTPKNAYLITKTDAGHGGGPVVTIGLYLCSYEQAEHIVDEDRRTEEAERRVRFERDTARGFSMDFEEYMEMYRMRYSIEQLQLQDLGGRDED